jgi:hypothetical protein
MRLQFASPTAADMQRLQDLMDGLAFSDEVKIAHRQLQRTSQIRVSEERHPGTIAIWQAAFLVTYGKPTLAEKTAWEKIQHKTGENLMTYSDRFKRLHDLCNPTSQLSRKAVTDSYLRGLQAIHQRLHEQVALVMSTLDEHQQTFQKASALAVERYEGLALFFPSKEDTPSPQPPIKQHQRAQSTNSQHGGPCTLCHVVHNSFQCPCVDPRQAEDDWTGPPTRQAWDVYNIAYKALDLRSAGMPRFACPVSRGPPQPSQKGRGQGNYRGNSNQRSYGQQGNTYRGKDRALPGPPPTSAGNDGIFMPDYPTSNFSGHQRRGEQARSLMTVQERELLRQQLGTDAYITQLCQLDGDDASSVGEDQEGVTWTDPWDTPAFDSTVQPASLGGNHPARVRAPPNPVYTPAATQATSPGRRQSPRLQQPNMLSAVAPPVPFPAVPLPTDIPLSQLPDALQHLRRPQQPSSNLSPAADQHAPALGDTINVSMLYMQNAGPGVLEGYIRGDTLVSFHLDGRERTLRVSDLHFPCTNDTVRGLLSGRAAQALETIGTSAPAELSTPKTVRTKRAKLVSPPPTLPCTPMHPAAAMALDVDSPSARFPPALVSFDIGANGLSPDSPVTSVDLNNQQPADDRQAFTPGSPPPQQPQQTADSPQPHTAAHAGPLPLLTPLFDCPTVYYLRSGDPASSLSLVHSARDVSFPFVRCIYDSGSNLNLISSSYCKQHGIEYDTTDGINMLTSSGAVSKTVGRVCTPLHFSLPNASGGTVKIRITLQVVHASVENFDILLGTPFMNAVASWVDVPTSMLCYRPQWHSIRSPAGQLRIPIITTTDSPDAAYRAAIAPRK